MTLIRDWLLQIFLDMAVLVEAQGEMLDNIEAQVGSVYALGQDDSAVSLLPSLPLRAWCWDFFFGKGARGPCWGKSVPICVGSGAVVE